MFIEMLRIDGVMIFLYTHTLHYKETLDMSSLST